MACVRDVEMNKGTSRVLQEGLSMGTRPKPDVLGTRREVATEKVSQEPACRNKTASVFRPDQALRACLFVRAQDVLRHLKAWKGRVYNPAPHVDVTRQQVALRRRNAPEGRRGDGVRRGVLHVCMVGRKRGHGHLVTRGPDERIVPGNGSVERTWGVPKNQRRMPR